MSFAEQLAVFELKATKKTRSVVQKIGMEAFGRIISRSPVKTGLFRNNWGCQIGSPFSGTFSEPDRSGSAASNRAISAVASWSGEGSIFLCNNLPYAQKLEYGSSTQAPQGMVRVTVAEMSGVINQMAG